MSASAQQPTFADLYTFEELDGTALGGVAEFQFPGSPDVTSQTITGSSLRFRNLADSRGDDLLARLDESGDPLWALQFVTEGDGGFESVGLLTVPSNRDDFLAARITGVFDGRPTYDVGRFDARTFEPVYSYQFRFPDFGDFTFNDQEELEVFFAGQNSYRIFSTDPEGTPNFFRRYTVPGITFDGFDSTERVPLPDGDGHLTVLAGLTSPDDEETATFLPIYTDVLGNITETTTALLIPELGEDSSLDLSFFPNGDLLLTVEETFSETDFSTTSGLLRLTREGNLLWAVRFANLSIESTIAPDGRLYLSGVQEASEVTDSAVILARVNPSTGDVLATRRFERDNDFPRLDFTGEGIVTQLSDFNEDTSAFTPVLLQLTDDLEITRSVLLTQSSDKSQIDFAEPAAQSNGQILFSGTSPDGAVAINLTGNLESPENCLTFTGIDLSTTAPDLNVSDLSVSFQQQTVTTEALTPDFPAGDLEFEQVQLSRSSFCQIRQRLFQPSIRLDSNQLIIEFPTTEGITYTLERSSSLGSFQDMNRTVLGGNGTGNFTLPLDAQKAFFRIRESGQ